MKKKAPKSIPAIDDVVDRVLRFKPTPKSAAAKKRAEKQTPKIQLIDMKRAAD